MTKHALRLSASAAAIVFEEGLWSWIEVSGLDVQKPTGQCRFPFLDETAKCSFHDINGCRAENDSISIGDNAKGYDDMDIEFHYYMTYLISVRAGFSPDRAAIIAQVAQEVDDNHISIKVSSNTPYEYDSVISQTMNILRPKHNEKIYPIFHFIPGEPEALSAGRKDGAMSIWTTTPNSPLANEMLETALRSDDLHRIGASAHAYADTWAHQNFLGKDDGLNEVPSESLAERAEGMVDLMRIGHALAGHLPDIPGLIWNDDRLVLSEIDNTARFMDAADHLFRKLALNINPNLSQHSLDVTSRSLVADLIGDIGPSSRTARQQDSTRIERYDARALTISYGGTAIPKYREGKWADEAFVEQHVGLKQQITIYLEREINTAGDMLGFGTSIPCTWKDMASYQLTDWWKFQQAIRSHLDECWVVLKGRLPDLS